MELSEVFCDKLKYLNLPQDLLLQIFQFTNKPIYHKYYINFPKKYHWDIGMFLSQKNAKLMLEYLLEKHKDIYDKLKHGDFIENGTLSGNRSAGLYIIEKKDNNIKLYDLSPEPDEYGTIPIHFIGLKDFLPGYNLDVIEDKNCKSFWHNTFFPIYIDYLKKLQINKFDFTNNFTYSECIFQNKKILIIYPSNYSFTNNNVEYYHYMIRDNNNDMYNYIEDYIDMNEFDFEVSDNEFCLLNSFSHLFDIILAPWVYCLIPNNHFYISNRLEHENIEYNSDDDKDEVEENEDIDLDNLVEDFEDVIASLDNEEDDDKVDEDN